MPTTYAHYRLGEEVRKQLPDSVRKIIDKHKELYHIGVHGPDYLFYYNPLVKNHVSSVGYATHELPGNVVFSRAAKIIHKCRNKDAHMAYVYGYLCHFAMDYVCHGYVAEQMDEKGLSHYEIESEYDRRLLVMDGFEQPVSVCTTKHLHPKRKYASVISDFYKGISSNQAYLAWVGMVFFLNILRAPSKIGRKILFAGMKMAGVYNDMHGFVMNYEENPACSETTDELVRRFPVSVDVAVSIIKEYEQYLKHGGRLSETFLYDFESERHMK